MAIVTRINDAHLAIVADLFEFVESIPETIISLTSGRKILVTASTEEIIVRVADFENRFGASTNGSGADRLDDGR